MPGRGPARSRPRALPRVHGDVQGRRSPVWEAVYDIARGIPRGRIMTYGQIATLLGSVVSPRAVGWALHGCPPGVPWQRVVNASGGCSTDRLPDIPEGLQRAMLEAEGVRFSAGGAIAGLERYRWTPPRAGAPRQAARRRSPSARRRR